TLHWYTGATMSGAIDAGGGSDNRLTLDGEGTDTFGQTISGFQSLEKRDGGTWTLGVSLPGSGITSTLVSGGTLILGTDPSSYTGTMDVAAAGTLQSSAQFAPQAIGNQGRVRFEQPDDATYAGLIWGTGALEKTGAGRLTLIRDQAYTGVTTISGGALRLGNGATGGAVLGDIVNNAALEVERSDTLTLGGLVSGAGTMRQAGTGTTVLTNNNSYTGGTFIDQGVL